MRILFAAFAGLALTTGSHAQVSGIYVERYVNSQWQNVPGFPNRTRPDSQGGPQPGLASGSDITIDGMSNGVSYRIFAVSPSTTDIGRITLNGFGGAQPTVFVGTGLISANPGASLSPGCKTLQSVVVGTSTQNLKPRLQVATNGDIGINPSTGAVVTDGVTAYEVVRIDARDIYTQIRHNPGADPACPQIGRLVCGNYSAAVNSFGGSIDFLLIGGAFTGGVNVLNCGNIAQVSGGFSSVLDSPIIIGNGKLFTVNLNGPIVAPTATTLRLSATAGIDSVSAPSIQGRIVANAGGSTGIIKRFATTAGAFSGTLEAYGLESDQANPGVSIAGQLSGNIQIGARGVREPISATSALTSTGSIVIGGDLRDDATDDGRITLPANGLQGQVIINASNNGSVWAGNVTVGTTTLSPIPYYNNLSSTLGGGAVGQVPYNLHQAESDARTKALTPGGLCTTIQTKVWPDGVTRETIVLHHYGRVQIPSFQGATAANANAGATKAYDVWTSPVYFTCDPPPAPCTPPFTVSTLPWVYRVMSDQAGSTRREVWMSIDATPIGGVVYLPGATAFRFSPVDANQVLRCEDTFLNPAPFIFDYTYDVSRGVCTDLNMSGIADPGDIDTWFEQPVDITGDGEAGILDITLVVEAVANR